MNQQGLQMPNDPQYTCPPIGYGTYKVGVIPASASGPKAAITRTTEECVTDALDVGYRFLDLAEYYRNEAGVGDAIQSSGVKRSDLFLCSKIWTTTIYKGEAAIREQVMKSLGNLHTDYLDMLLVHWPVPGKHVAAYKTLESLQREGKVRSIGVSNYMIEDYEELLQADVAQKPCVNQIEINPFLYRQKTIEYFRNQGVLLQSYRSLANGKQFEHPLLKEIASKHDCTTGQVLGRWCVQHGIVYLPKSTRKERMIENKDVFNFSLSEDEMRRLDGLTTVEAKAVCRKAYQQCVNRDTPLDGSMTGVRTVMTLE